MRYRYDNKYRINIDKSINIDRCALVRMLEIIMMQLYLKTIEKLTYSFFKTVQTVVYCTYNLIFNHKLLTNFRNKYKKFI